jgi:hypothetical protein
MFRCIIISVTLENPKPPICGREGGEAKKLKRGPSFSQVSV